MSFSLCRLSCILELGKDMICRVPIKKLLAEDTDFAEHFFVWLGYVFLALGQRICFL
jgi:hypothetical protein